MIISCYTCNSRWQWSFPEMEQKFSEIRDLINHWIMNWSQSKDPVSHMCLAGAVVASWSLTQEVTDSSPFNAMTNIFLSLNFLNSTKIFSENSIIMSAGIWYSFLPVLSHNVFSTKTFKYQNWLQMKQVAFQLNANHPLAESMGHIKFEGM